VRLPASLTVIEASAFKGCYNLQTLTRAGYALTEIGDNAFYDCDLITEFHFDATLKKIGEDAFFSTALTECMLPEGLQTVGSGAFNDCTQMTNVYIPTTVTAIGSSAFPGNIVTLTAPILPDTVMAASDRYVLFSMLKTVTVIGTASEVPAGYFEGYYDLETVTLPSSVTAIGDDAFSYCENLTAVIGGSIKTVGKSAFSYCKSYTVLALGSQLESIGDFAFEGTAIVQISFPDSLTSIGKSAFESVHSLTSVTFGRGMRTVGNYAFSGCEELRTLSLNEGLTHIGAGAFEYTALTELTLPSSLQVLGTSAFYDTEIERLTLSLPLVDEKGRSIYMENVLSPETLLYATVREGCTTLPKNFFTYCSSLVEVTLPSSLRVIDDYAFFECESLERLNFTPTSLTDIGDSAFYYCISLAEFPFAAPLKVIDNGAFASTSLERVILPQGLQRIGDGAFDDCAMSELYVPTSVTSFNGTDGCSNLTKVSMPITLVDRYFEYIFEGSSVEHLVILGNPSEITDAYFCNAS
ncbi:MAG: leucine-rich repeat protein, partial [Alistipes sp.]|nr:leucine-rich repeat protein [Alistipes sp.]